DGNLSFWFGSTARALDIANPSPGSKRATPGGLRPDESTRAARHLITEDVSENIPRSPRVRERPECCQSQHLLSSRMPSPTAPFVIHSSLKLDGNEVMLARKASKSARGSKVSAPLGYEAELWKMADALRGSMDAAEYKHVVLG